MARARKILKRAKAVKNIRTVTKTMEMVATARFKKTHDRAVAGRPYTDCLMDMVADMVRSSGSDLGHPLTRENDAQRDVLIVITGNRGLCGSYNSSVVRLAMERYRQLKAAGREVDLYVAGKKGIQFFRYRGLKVVRAMTEFDYLPDYKGVSAVADELIAAFTARNLGGLEIAYCEFMSTSRQKPAISQVLPLTSLPVPSGPQKAKGPRANFEFIPSVSEVLDRLLPAAVRMKVYQCFVDAAASEQVARMVAMKSATDNADDMLHELTVRYNRMRQSQITTELSEIIGGQAGMAE